MKKSLLIASLMLAAQPMIVDVPNTVAITSRTLDMPPLAAGSKIRRNKGEKKRNKADRWR